MGSPNVMLIPLAVVASEYSNGLENVRTRYCSAIEDRTNHSQVRLVFGVKTLVLCGGSGLKVGGQQSGSRLGIRKAKAVKNRGKIMVLGDVQLSLGAASVDIVTQKIGDRAPAAALETRVQTGTKGIQDLTGIAGDQLIMHMN